MQNLSDISVIKEILGRHGFNFSKSLGQNFLINPSVCPRMAQKCGAAPDTGVLEIGPGIGVLTQQLAERAGKVVSVELDKSLFPVLNETLSEFNNIKIINGDVLKLDLHKLIKEEFDGMKISVCANLPYYITSPIIMKLLEEKLPVENITVMVQKEAADRLCAEVGTRECGAVTIAVDYYADAERLFNVSSGSFIPAPKVDSSVIRLNIRKNLLVSPSDEKFFFRVIKAAFSQRRKTALNAISSGLGVSKTMVSEALSEAGLEQTVRAERIKTSQFALLSDILLSKLAD